MGYNKSISIEENIMPINTLQRREFLHHHVEGDGPPVIMIHGISQAMTDWHALTPELVSAGFSAIAVDLLGHGDSPKPEEAEYYTMRTVYGTFESWVEALRLDPPYYMVGHSLGGYLTLNYALRNPEDIGAMVLINPLFSLKQLSGFLNFFMPLNGLGVRLLKSTPQWLVNSFLERSDSFTTRLPPDARLMYARNVKRASPYFLRIPETAEDLIPQLGHITPKTLVIYGLLDYIENPESFPQLVAALPNADGLPMEGCGHQPHHNNPELVNQTIVDFFCINCDQVVH